MARSQRGSRYWSLIAVTLITVGVMLALSMRQQRGAQATADSTAGRAPPVARVAAQQIRVGTQEIVETYSGLLEPWERYQLGFEIGGRVAELGPGAAGPLDEGDKVEAGQLLARLDDRTLLARRNEAAARWEQAEADLQRVRGLRARNVGAISDSELQGFVTQVAVARAQREMATEAIRDTVLNAPAAGTLARRMILAGESVNANQICFEIVEDDRLILKLGVPEARIPEILARRQEVVRNTKLQTEVAVDPQDLIFQARVQLVGKDRFGRAWPALKGTVHHISDTADDHTGLFGVEIEVANQDGRLKPGMIARAELITQRLTGYRLPTRSVIFRGGQAFLFALVDLETVPSESRENASRQLGKARRVELPRWVEQRGEVIVPGTPEGFQWVIVGGQHRLVDGQAVELVPAAPPQPATSESRVSTAKKLSTPISSGDAHGS